MKTLRFGLQMGLGILLPLIVQLLDWRRMTLEEREYAWTYSTWGSALYAFGPFSMLGWAWVTRREWSRKTSAWLPPPVRAPLVLLAGLAIALLLFAMMYGVDALFERVFPESAG